MLLGTPSWSPRAMMVSLDRASRSAPERMMARQACGKIEVRAVRSSPAMPPASRARPESRRRSFSFIAARVGRRGRSEFSASGGFGAFKIFRQLSELRSTAFPTRSIFRHESPQ